jgi:hypothetical protein
MVAVWIILAIVADPAGPPVQVTGTAACPAAADVQGALAGLIPPREPEVAPDVATLTDDASAVVLALRRASGERIGEKRLDPGLPCAERGTRRGGDHRGLGSPPRHAGDRARRAAARAGAATRRSRRSRGATRPIGGGPDSHRAGRRRRRLDQRHDARALGHDRGRLLAPDGTVVPAVAALFVGAHNLAVGPGDAAWRRYGLVATVASRRSWPAVWAEARTGLAFTLLDISGSSYPRNGSAVTFDPGVTFGLRVGTRSPRIRWWLDALITLWPRDQEVYVQGVPGTATLPRGGALLGVGASYEGR